MISAKDLLLKQIPEDCLWLEMDKLDNCPIEAVTKAMVEFAQLKVNEALQAVIEKATVNEPYVFGTTSDEERIESYDLSCLRLSVNQFSILNAYKKIYNNMSKTGVELIAEERHRQLVRENWSEDHDMEHTGEELAVAAAAYCLPLRFYNREKLWPWEIEWWKPSPEDRVKELVKAGSLIAAEIDRLQNRSRESKLNEIIQ